MSFGGTAKSSRESSGERRSEATKRASLLRVNSHVKQQRFWEVCRWLHVPLSAAADWSVVSDSPLASMVACFTAGVGYIGVVLLSITYGCKHVNDRASRRYAATIPLVVSVLAFLYFIWRHGPRVHLQFPRRTKGCIAAHLLISLIVLLVCLLSAEEDAIFHNRLALLGILTFLCATVLTMLFLTYLESERGAASTPFYKILLRIGMRTIRLADCFSDIMYCRVVWEKVCSTAEVTKGASVDSLAWCLAHPRDFLMWISVCVAPRLLEAMAFGAQQCHKQWIFCR